jgi:hypothetical protein
MRGDRSGRAVARENRTVPRRRLLLPRPQARRPACPDHLSAPRPRKVAIPRARTSVAGVARVPAPAMCVRWRPSASGKPPIQTSARPKAAGTAGRTAARSRQHLPCRPLPKRPSSSSWPNRPSSSGQAHRSSGAIRHRCRVRQSAMVMMHRSMRRSTSAPTIVACSSPSRPAPASSALSMPFRASCGSARGSVRAAGFPKMRWIAPSRR